MKIGIVLVTFNRKDDLIKALECYECQTKIPEFVLVVNNNSNDGTKELLEKWSIENARYKKIVIHLPENIGGSGGFYTGLKEGLRLNVDWLWVSDDDAFPEQDALMKVDEYYKKKNLSYDGIAAICGAVINNGNYDLQHRRVLEQRMFKVDEVPIPEAMYNEESFELNLFSYVGTVINCSYLKKYGLTERDYFIYYDDTEHSLRLSQKGKIICLPNVRIHHNTPLINDGLNWKNFYGMRNQLHAYKLHLPKRFYNYLYFKLLIKALITKDSNTRLIIQAALREAKEGKKGLNDLFKPGWTPKK